MMESLLDQADALVVANPDGTPPRPDFPIPEECLVSSSLLMECKEGIKGRGWFAKQPIAAGTVLLVEKPLAMVMDWQDTVDDEDDIEEDEEEQAGGSIVNDLLLLELLKYIQTNPSLWTEKLSNLYPRDDKTAALLPVWICRDDALFVDIEAKFQQLENVFSSETAKNIAKRLPLIVRYNVLSIETCPELLIHPGPNGHATLSGAGIYYQASYLNHDAHPNASRWAVGDVMWFVTNQNVEQGEEICISYLEHDVLTESATRRTEMLDMDFSEEQDTIQVENEQEGPLFPVVDSEVQNELMTMDVMERLAAIEELMQQATGESLPQDEIAEAGEDSMEVGQPEWFQCDAHNLRIIKAITLEGMGQSKEALPIWEQCVSFTETKLPPNDESSVVMHVQAALCAQHAGDIEVAKAHAAAALETHNTMFGGGMTRFRRRYERELKMALRPSADVMADTNALWPITS